MHYNSKGKVKEFYDFNVSIASSSNFENKYYLTSTNSDRQWRQF
jgi:hypothetical protein